MVACLVHVPFLLTMRVYGSHCKLRFCFTYCMFVSSYAEMILCLWQSTNMKKNRLDALVSMRDISVRPRSPATWSRPAGRKKNIF